MKRNVTIKSPLGIEVKVKIDTKQFLTRDETEKVKDYLADDIMDSLARVPYLSTYKNKLSVI